MIDQKRLVKMTGLSKMESGSPERDRYFAIGHYKRLDYMTLQMILGILSGTLCYAAILLFWTGCRWDTMDSLLVREGYRGIAVQITGGYVLFMIAYLLLCGFVSRRSYQKAGVETAAYLDKLNQLENIYASGAEDAEPEEEPEEKR